ncbi:MULTISPECIES: SusD/RagB family nutrient-binding outer membrane lipoprotein [unclassified Myroides]|uniref:SusD/RagB family nutrient-binding outer membrane lipoprotein n=1 Tax=unclassified Myroides TaxID=2642485 RepID=UPI003D2F97EC
MKKIIYTSLCLLSVWFMSCEKIDELQDDPNRVSSSTPDLIFTAIQIAASNNISTSAALATRQLGNTDGVSDHQYYNWQRAGFDNYFKLKQISKLKQEAIHYDAPVYLALAKFYESYFIVETTLLFGDVPFSEAVRIEQEITSPAYDAQKDIFVQVLQNLKEANEELAQIEQVIKGDILYKGEVYKWRKLVNSYTLKVLLDLSVKSNDPDLKVIQTFNEIVSNPSKYPIFENLTDSAFLNYVDSKTNQYPYFNNNSLQTAFYLEESFVEKLKDLKDSRLFSMADMINERVDDNKENFANYGGIKGSDALQDNVKKVMQGKVSRINARYYLDPVNEPSVLLSYWELQFVLAEASERGWIPNKTEEYYTNGIKASFAFYKKQSTQAYLDQEKVVLNGVNNLERILTQKHIASFMNSGWQSFFDNRRTGYPVFNNDGTGVLNGGRIPKRWMYPNSESINNDTNLNRAIDQQFTNGDNIYELMWLLK